MEEKNIFEEAAKQLSRPGKKKLKKVEETPRSAIPDIDPLAISPNKGDPEVIEMMEKIKTMRLDLQKKLENIYQISGTQPETLQKYLDNPKNFSSKDWETIQESKGVLNDKIWQTVGEELKPRTTYVRENQAGERKGKTLGGRKKWIPMP